MVDMSFYDDGTAAQEAANDQACIDARRAAGLTDELPDDTDCEYGCPIHKTSCPFFNENAYGFKPSPPGDTIRDICQERGISRSKLGKMLRLSNNSILQLLDGSLNIDNDLAYCLSKVLGSSSTFWINREKQYREAIALLKEGVGK
jgi:plasmid maintenance system antidote protein VapI